MKLTLLYNAAAHFAAMEQYPDGLINELTKSGTESFKALCWAIGELSAQAAASRKFLGLETPDPITKEKAAAILRPTDLIPAKTAVFEAVARGLGSRNDEEEVDEVLLELQKKTGIA